MPPPLHHIWVKNDTPPERVLLVLHGILGAGQNFGALARSLVTARPQWGVVLVDLRFHGRSGPRPGPQSLRAAAEDVAQLAESLPASVEGLLGHSFGGKVAATAASLWRAPLGRLWMLDSPPGARAAGAGSESTLQVLDILERAPRRPESRATFVSHLEAQGITRGTSQWLAMNLRRVESGYELGLDFAAIRALLDDYFTRDLWPWIETTQTPTTLVRAGRSDLWSEAERAHATRVAAERPTVTLREVPEAGHWLHVDAPEATLEAVLADLPA